MPDVRSDVLTAKSKSDWPTMRRLTTAWVKAEPKNPEAILLNAYAAELNWKLGTEAQQNDEKLGREALKLVDQAPAQVEKIDPNAEAIFVWLPRMDALLLRNRPGMRELCYRGINAYPKSEPVRRAFFEYLCYLCDRGWDQYESEKYTQMAELVKLAPKDEVLLDVYASHLEKTGDFAGGVEVRNQILALNGKLMEEALRHRCQDNLGFDPPHTKDALADAELLMSTYPTSKDMVRYKGFKARAEKYELLKDILPTVDFDQRQDNTLTAEQKQKVKEILDILLPAFDKGYLSFGGDLSDCYFLLGEADKGIHVLNIYVRNGQTVTDPDSEWKRHKAYYDLVEARFQLSEADRKQQEEDRAKKARDAENDPANYEQVQIPQTIEDLHQVLSGTYRIRLDSNQDSTIWYDCVLNIVWSPTEKECHATGTIKASSLVKTEGQADFTVTLTISKLAGHTDIVAKDQKITPVTESPRLFTQFPDDLCAGRLGISKDGTKLLIAKSEEVYWSKDRVKKRKK